MSTSDFCGVNLADYFAPIEYDELPWPDIDEPGEFNSFGWRNLLTASHPWDETRRPHTNPLDYEDVKTDYEKLDSDGYLTHIICANQISNLDIIPGTVQYGLTKLQLPARNIKNIEVLKSYKLLQYLDLSYNKISDITALKKIKHLIVLDLSHNRLVNFQILPPPLFLGYLNLSSNRFYRMPNFNALWSLKHLNLSYNKIVDIEGIENLTFLRYLNLSHNVIIKVKNLKNISLIELDLSHNSIKTWEDLPDDSPNCLYTLKVLNASHNELTSLNVFRNAYNLQVLNLSFNRITEISEFDYMAHIKSLKKLFLIGNKLSTSITDFRCLCLHFLEHLEELNGVPITSAEKISSMFTYKNNTILNEVSVHVKKKILSMILSPPAFGEMITTTSNETSIIALVGPPGTYKEQLANMVAAKHPVYVKRSKLHTTVPPTNDSITVGKEEHSKHFIHVSVKTFRQMDLNGEMIFVATRKGYKFGLSVKELADDGRLSVVSLGIIGALNLYWGGYKAVLILLNTVNNNIYKKRIQEYFKQIQVLESLRTRAADSSDESSDDGLFINLNIGNQHLNQYGEKLKNRHKSISSLRKFELNQSVDFEDETVPEKKPAVTTKNPGKKKWVVEEPIQGEIFDSNIHLTCSKVSANYYEREKAFVCDMMFARDRYTQMHKDNPGLFIMNIAVDNLHRAYKKILKIMRNHYNSLDSVKTKLKFNKNSSAYNELVQVNIKNMMESILNQNGPLRQTVN